MGGARGPRSNKRSVRGGDMEARPVGEGHCGLGCRREEPGCGFQRVKALFAELRRNRREPEAVAKEGFV